MGFGGVLTGYNAEALVAQNTDVVIPEGVATIEANAFFNTPLSSVVLPSTLIEIGPSAFEATPLNSVVIPESIKSFANEAFDDGVSRIVVGPVFTPLDAVNYIAQIGTDVVIPEGVTSIAPHAFANSQLTSVELWYTSNHRMAPSLAPN